MAIQEEPMLTAWPVSHTYLNNGWLEVLPNLSHSLTINSIFRFHLYIFTAMPRDELSRRTRASLRSRFLFQSLVVKKTAQLMNHLLFMRITAVEVGLRTFSLTC